MSKRTPLSPIDITFYGRNSYSIEFAFQFESRLDPALLQTSLDQCLDAFWPIRSEMNESANGFEIVDVNRKIEIQVEDLGDTEFDPSVPESMVRFSAGRIDTLPGEQLSRFRLSHLGGRGSILSVNLSHSLVDGYSYFYFLSSWARTARGEKFHPPRHDRECLLESGEDVEELTFEGLRESTGFGFYGPRNFPELSELRWEKKDFAEEELKGQLASCGEALGPDAPALSRNDVISAALWNHYANKWGAESPAGKKFTLACAFDYRRVHPKLDPSYFGNSVRGAFTERTLDELGDLPSTSLAIRKMTGSIKGEEAIQSLKVLDAYRLQRGVEALQQIHVADPDSGYLVTNLSRVPVADINFGSGSPVAFCSVTAAPKASVLLKSSQGISAITGLPA